MQQQRNGQSVRAFCRDRQLSEHSFYQWRKQLGKQVAMAKPVSFALVETSRQKLAAPIELILSSGHTLRIPADATTLRLVIDALQPNTPA